MENFKEVFESRYTWIEGFMRNVRRFGQRNALIDPLSGREWTYKAINQEVNRLCNAFIKAGVKKGDVIMLQMLNCPEFVFAYVACHKMQCVCCPVNFRLSPGEMAWNVDDSKPAIIICCESKCKEVNNALQNTKHKPSCVIGLISDSTDGIIAYNDFIKDASADEPVITTPYNIYDETVRLYTSGTTGRPKGVCITSINEVLSAHDIMIHFPMSSRDITMNTTPWFHRGGLHCAGPCPALYAGASMVIMGKFDALMALKYVYRYKITFIVGVPTVLEELADRQEQGGYDLSSLTGIVTMGSPLERAACIRYQKVLTPNIYNGYGTTETLWNTFLRPFDLPDNAGSAGRSCVDDDVRVVKIYEDRRTEPEDLAAQDGVDVGEVIISSPAKSPFLYHDNPSET
ncbi:MAG: AMP-binding protein, partial [Prevotella sp.]|nr:AMP-binding protein [Prevotella sp.]